MEVNEGWRTMPYLADGSIGIGMVVDDYLAYRDDEQFAEAGAAIQRAAEYAFYIYPGLLSGRAGMLLYQARRRAAGMPGRDDAIADHVRRLAWHALALRGPSGVPRRAAPAPFDGPRHGHRRRAARAGRRPRREPGAPALPRAAPRRAPLQASRAGDRREVTSDRADPDLAVRTCLTTRGPGGTSTS